MKITSYSNLIENKKLIYKENRDKIGVYRLVNIITNKSYIGSSINLSKRFVMYFNVKVLEGQLLRNKSLIYSSIKHYKVSNFRLEILEYCSQDILRQREQYYVDTLKPEYNLLPNTITRLGSKHYEETKYKISLKTKEMNYKHFLGKNHSLESKTLISFNRSISIKVIDTFKNIVFIFKGNKEVMKYLNISRSSLINYKKSKKLIHKRYLVENL